MNGVTVTRRLNSLKQCLKSCSLFPQVDVLITYETCAYYSMKNRPLTLTLTPHRPATTMEMRDEVRGETNY